MRWLGISRDAEPGGSTYDALSDPGPLAWPASTVFVPVTTANVDPGLSDLDRNDEVRGRRGNTAPVSFASAPSGSFSARAYPELVRALIPDSLGEITGTTGVAPAARTTEVVPVGDTGAAGVLPARFLTVVREEQIDRLAGAIVEEWTLSLPIDAEGTLEFTMPALYHEVDATEDVAGLPTPAYVGWDDTYMLRDVVAYTGDGAGVRIDCLAGATLTFNNGLVDEFRSRFCAGENVRASVAGGGTRRLWFPKRHKLGPQAVTGTLDFGTTRPDLEERRILRLAEKLVLELTAGPITGAIPAANEMVRFTIAKHVLTGGGAGALEREGDITSSYEFSGYIDPATGDDFAAEFVGGAAIAF